MSNWGWTQRKRVLICTAALVVVAVLGLTAFVVRKSTLDAVRCEQATSFIRDEGAIIDAGNGGTSTGVLGDSYTAGDLLDDYRDGWAFQLASYTDVTVHAAGVGSTGFLAEGPCGDQSYPKRAPYFNRTMPDTLIIQGGLNDVTSNPDTVAAGADATLVAVDKVDRVIVVGPVDAPNLGNEASIDAQLAAVAELRGREYVSALDWDLDFLPDRIHLTPAGHQKFAELVAEAL